LGNFAVGSVLFCCCYCGDLREGDNWEDLGVDGRIILKWVYKKWDEGGMEWIDMAQDMDRWRAVVSVVMNLRVP
jgi:hypothetical protein